MLDYETRKRIRLSSESGVMQGVVQNGETTGLEIARCQIDGMMNGLIRLEGAEKAAEFVFSLSDRVAGGLLQPTDFRERDGEDPDDFDNDKDQVKQPEPRQRPLWPTYLFGVVHGVALAMYLRWLLGSVG